MDKGSGVAEKESAQPRPRTHKPYDAGFRQPAVELLLTSGKAFRDVARDWGVSVDPCGLGDRKPPSRRPGRRLPAARPWLWNGSINGGGVNWLPPSGSAQS